MRINIFYKFIYFTLYDIYVMLIIPIKKIVHNHSLMRERITTTYFKKLILRILIWYAYAYNYNYLISSTDIYILIFIINRVVF